MNEADSPKNDEGRDWSDEELVAWLLDPEARREHSREELERIAGVGQRLEDYGGFLDRCREELRAGEGLETEHSSALSDEIIARTTREDVSWRGDLRLVGSFLSHSLRSSVLLRVVAASLLVHMAALPVLAYYTWVQLKPQTRIEFEVSGVPRELPYREAEPEGGLDPAEPGSSEKAEVQERALDSLGTVSGAAPSAEELFRQRLAHQGLINMDGFSAELPAETKVWGDTLGLVLRAELLLDELEVPIGSGGRRREAHLAFVLGHLRRSLKALEIQDDRPALREIAASAWLRARAAGRGPEDPQLSAFCVQEVRGGSDQQPNLEGEGWQAAFGRAQRESDDE